MEEAIVTGGGVLVNDEVEEALGDVGRGIIGCGW